MELKKALLPTFNLAIFTRRRKYFFSILPYLIPINSLVISCLSMHFQAIHKCHQKVDYPNHNKNHKTNCLRESPEKTYLDRGLPKVIVGQAIRD